MVANAYAGLDGITHYMKNNLPDQEYAKLVRSIGGSMGEQYDLTRALYAAHHASFDKVRTRIAKRHLILSLSKDEADAASSECTKDTKERGRGNTLLRSPSPVERAVFAARL
jgi:hypothetical protein